MLTFVALFCLNESGGELSACLVEISQEQGETQSPLNDLFDTDGDDDMDFAQNPLPHLMVINRTYPQWEQSCSDPYIDPNERPPRS